MNDLAIGFDTSNYTTSCAVFNGREGTNSSRLLDVKEGELGLRQSEALFSHVKRLPEVAAALGTLDGITAVGASSKPREAEDSYMPCFLAGASQARVLAGVLGVPYYEFSHQQGHVAAAAFSAGRMELLDTPHLAWHLSGGTTELLYVRPCGANVTCELIGGTTDVSAGQLIDRTGQMLGLRFPAGQELDALTAGSAKKASYQPKVSGFEFSLSGVEHKVKTMHQNGETREDIAYFAIKSVVNAVAKVTDAAIAKYGDIPVLFSGGVASSNLLRSEAPFGLYAKPEHSKDNALGVAILTYRAVTANGK